MDTKIREELFYLAEPEYQRFNSRLIPNIEPDRILGVRLPVLRKLAAKLAGGRWREYLETGQEEFFEEIMLKGMVIGCAKMEFSERLSYVEWFLPKIDNCGRNVELCQAVPGG